MFASKAGRNCTVPATHHVRFEELTDGTLSDFMPASELCRKHAAFAVQDGATQVHSMAADCLMPSMMWVVTENLCVLDDSAPDPFEGVVLW